MVILHIVGIIIGLILLVLSYYGLKYLWPVPVVGDWTLASDSSSIPSDFREVFSNKISISKNALKVISFGQNNTQIQFAYDFSNKTNEYIGPNIGPNSRIIYVYKNNMINIYAENTSTGERQHICNYKKYN